MNPLNWLGVISTLYGIYLVLVMKAIEVKYIRARLCKEWIDGKAFNTKFNLNSHTPQRDICQKCDLLK
uniref:Uncharacterized protein n=1 Tax=Glossina palpalis gambiensis TaxID=67801 RepID=A0A1B0AZ30_9MUSC